VKEVFMPMQIMFKCVPVTNQYLAMGIMFLDEGKNGSVWWGSNSRLTWPPHRHSSGRVLASSAGGPGFNPQSKISSFQRCYKNGTIISLL